MKLELRQLNSIHAGLMWLFRRELDAKLQYYVARNVAKIGDELKRIAEVKQEVLDKHGAVLPETGEDEDNEAQEYEFPTEEAEAKAQEEFDDLLNEAVEVDIVPLKIAWLNDIKFAGAQMYGLWRIIEAPAPLSEMEGQNEV